MKFKVGDRVVTITARPFHQEDYPPFSKAKIVEITINETIILEMFDGFTQQCNERNLEHELVYNSPLYLALR